MKAMFGAFGLAIVMAIGMAAFLNASYQSTASNRFNGSGADVRDSAGYNLVGKDWSGLGRPQQN